MMTVGTDSANIEFTRDEFNTLLYTLGCRIAAMENNLADCDRHKYIEIRQLYSKIASVLDLIEYEDNIEADTQENIKNEYLSVSK